MGIYRRKDSVYWWMTIERPRQKPLRRSTGIPIDGGAPALDKQRAAEAQKVYAIEKSKHVLGLINPEKPSISFRDYADWYETHLTAHFRSASKQKSMLKGLRLYFADVDRLADLDASAVEVWKTARKKQVKPSTVNRELDVLKAMLASAVPKYLTHSPLGGVRRFRITETEPRVLTPKEEDDLLAICTPAETAFIQLAIDTLLRLSNVVNLRWAQVKLDQRVIVPLNAKVTLDAVPITNRCALALKELPKDGPYVFAWLHKGHGETAAKNIAIRVFNTLCQKAGLAYGRAAQGLTFHCLRHTGATRALQKGASIRTVMKLGGWRDERMVIRYTHATDEDVRAAAESISAKPLTFKKRRA